MPLSEQGPALDDLAAVLSPYGLIPRGGFHPDAEESDFSGARTVLLIGNAGGATWEAFALHIDGKPNPLDRWTKRVIDPIAARFDAHVAYPFDNPHPPFQRWALRADAVFPSPLGILIHPEYGLWHAYRAALLFSEHIDLPARPPAESPCETCATKPCLSACPVNAFTRDGYDMPACAEHLTGSDQTCTTLGCHARNACPVGREWRYPEAQIRFHMAAFARSVGAGLAV